MYQYQDNLVDNQQGLNGWFGRFLKSAIKGVASLVDKALAFETFGLSTQIGSFSAWADEIGSGGSSFWNKSALPINNIENDPRAQYEPNSLEEPILQKFAEEFTKLIIDVSENAIKNVENLPFSNTKIKNANALLQRIATVKAYYQFHEMDRLSYAAVQLRNLLIESLFIPVENLIKSQFDNSIEQTTVVVSIPAKTVLTDLEPFNKVNTLKLSPTFKIYELNIKTTLPPDDIVIDFPPPPPPDNDTVIDIPPTNDTPVDVDVTPPNGSGIMWLAIIAGGVLAFNALKKKQKNQK